MTDLGTDCPQCGQPLGLVIGEGDDERDPNIGGAELCRQHGAAVRYLPRLDWDAEVADIRRCVALVVAGPYPYPAEVCDD